MSDGGLVLVALCTAHWHSTSMQWYDVGRPTYASLPVDHMPDTCPGKPYTYTFFSAPDAAKCGPTRPPEVPVAKSSEVPAECSESEKGKRLK